MKRTSLLVFLMALVVSAQAFASTVIWYDFEDGIASTAMYNVIVPNDNRLGSVDLSGNGYDFHAWSATGGPSFSAAGDTVTGEGLSAVFSGGQDGYNADAGLVNWSPEAWTMELSFKYTTLESYKTLIGKDTSAGLSEANLSAFYLQTDGANGNAIRLQYVSTSGERFILITSLVPVVNQWYNMVVRSDGRYLDIMVDYLDGAGFVSVGSWDLDSETNSLGDVDHSIKVTGTWTFGRGWYGGNGDFLKGNIDDIRFSDVALDESEFLQNEGVVISYPSPISRSTLVGIDTDLSWQLVDGFTADYYRVYISSDPNDYNEPNSFETSAYTQVTSPALALDTLEFETLYKWRVDTYLAGSTEAVKGSLWSFTTAPDAVVIINQPKSATADPSATFSVTASGAQAYAWYKEGSDTVLSNDSTLTIADATLADEGMYYCMVYNGEIGGANTDEPTSTIHVNLWTARMVGYWPFDADLTDAIATVVPGAPAHDGALGIHAVEPANVGDGAFEFGTGIVDGAISFTNDSDYVAIADSEFNNFYVNGFTISMWYKFVGETNPGWRLPMSKLDAGTDGWLIGVDASNRAQFIVEGGGAALYGNTAANASDGQWHLLTATYTPATNAIVLYTDGLASAVKTYSLITDGVPAALVSIGGRDTENSISGMIDEVKMYSYPMTQTEIIDNLYYDITGKGVCINSYSSAYDFNTDCKVDMADFAKIATAWLECGRYPVESCN